jgi:hypothetical protein
MNAARHDTARRPDLSGVTCGREPPRGRPPLGSTRGDLQSRIRRSFRAERSGRPGERPAAAGPLRPVRCGRSRRRRPAIDRLSNLSQNMDNLMYHENPSIRGRCARRSLVGTNGTPGVLDRLFWDVSETGTSGFADSGRLSVRLEIWLRLSGKVADRELPAACHGFFGGAAGTISRSSSSREIRGRRPV